ncbi:hypothetical protein H6G54_28760 [Anabaena cylindrica FACHB-243]|uniref:hypothetical protein n=1 Tax=Anabaena TaxID=1163 RepID=UPI00123718B4|nr:MULTISPECIES: hypothetical protein [Anabaena]MBD2421598.1 hypothetical protein [Anabaena cylindrica FACHB-243]MBY5280503.1 hypothetical protein [Anabaena sp. CCAP 1446/1C]MBY5308234.1 hypothetical protein [Anabaena sp. CCAP 1446/1C]MCM2405501.1 hypothetical protein [Anabaena sp. CCAP 1446/1C]
MLKRLFDNGSFQLPHNTDDNVVRVLQPSCEVEFLQVSALAIAPGKRTLSLLNTLNSLTS